MLKLPGTRPDAGKAGPTCRFRRWAWTRPCGPGRPSPRPGRRRAPWPAPTRSSPEVLAAETGYDGPLTVDPDLREQDLGEWNGRTNAEIAAVWPAELEAR